MILITLSARERIRNILSGRLDNRLRIEIISGGCNGFEKKFTISNIQPDDIEVDQLVVIDPVTWDFLQNAILDFNIDISSYGFKISIPDAASNCGCGKSFSI